MENQHNIFVHFDTPYICQEFVIYAKQQQYEIGQKACCGGKGCAIYHIDRGVVNTLKDDFLRQYIPRKPIMKVDITDECCICLELTHFTTHCHHFICETCVTNINLCPLCRRII